MMFADYRWSWLLSRTDGMVMLITVLGTILFAGLLLLKGLRKQIRISTARPFTSRAEYLEAALEMDLDVFLARARITPRSVIQKVKYEMDVKLEAYRAAGLISPLFPAESPGLPADATKIGGKILEFKQQQLESWGTGEIFTVINDLINKFSRGLEEVVALKKIEPITNSLPGQPESSAPQSTAKRAKWFRSKDGDGKLFCLQEARSNGCSAYQDSAGPVNVIDAHLEPAYPKGGEWWRWTQYDVEGLRAKDLLPFRWCDDKVDNSVHASKVRDGLLEPVNFGRGQVGGCWRRRENGDLIYVIGASAFEIAYPQADEWWEKKPCSIKHSVAEFIMGKRQWLAPSHQTEINEELSAVACGCLVPINRGKGEEQKSGVA
jgi:hypothetical protein